jgi:acyl-CoA thioesterase-1
MKGLLLLILSGLCGPLVAATPTLLVLGDSLSAGYGINPERGWVSLLQQRIEAAGLPHRVINAGISGDTTSGGVRRLPRSLEVYQPAVVIIELGANDGLRGLSLDELRANLTRMVDLSLASGARVLLLGMHIPPNYGRRFADAFHQVYQDVATEAGVPLVPFFLEGVVDSPGLMQDDNIHPNEIGQARMLDNVWAYLRPLLESSVRPGGALSGSGSA